MAQGLLDCPVEPGNDSDGGTLNTLKSGSLIPEVELSGQMRAAPR